MKVVISVGGRFHAVALAEQLEKRGLLERIITTKAWYVKDVLPAARWRALPAAEYAGMIVRAMGPFRRRGYYSYVKDNLFDAMSRRYIPPCDVFHAWGNYGLIAMPYARAHGASVVIERGSTHPKYQDEILREEFARYGVATERAHPQIIEKGLREIELADRVIIPSEFVRRTFIANGIPDEKLTVIPYGTDLSRFAAAPKKDSVFRVLFVGNIGIQKGVHYLLEAWKQLALRDAELVLIGRVEADARPVLEKYAGLFTLRGHVRHEELPVEYTNASVFVLPSLQEGSALVTYEAMACGLPLIVSENTGSVVRDGIDGAVVPIRNVEALKEAILDLHEHPDKAVSMGSQGARHVAAFTWDRYAESVIDVYHTLRTQVPADR